MIAENMVMFKVSVFNCENPQQLWKEILPTNCIESKWIPQTMGDQVWMWFEFRNQLDKEEYIDWVNASHISCQSAWSIDIETTTYLKDMLFDFSQEQINQWV